MVWRSSFIIVLLTLSLQSTGKDKDPFTAPAVVPPYKITKVVIDPGHGGKDPGCLGSIHQEKEIALAISLKLGAMIDAAFPDVEVIYTRKTDVFIPLHERARIANKAGADLFISVHCNTAGKRNGAVGTETFIMGLHRAKDNLNVAKRENAAILMEDDYLQQYDGYDPESDEGHIILSMYQNAHLEQSILLAHSIENQFTHVCKRHSRGVKQAGFLVLRNTAMPSVLVETGFLSHDEDEFFLSTDEGQTKMAEGIFKAFAEYKEMMEASAVVTEAPSTSARSMDEPVQPDIFVQLAASTHELDVDANPWRVYENIVVRKEKDYYKYLAGPFETIEAAGNAKAKFTSDGFSEAFLVAYRGETRIPLDEVRGR